ncbi:MAG: glycosyltransferase, partial [Planctomycetota bacterium]
MTTPSISIVVPTFREAKNVSELLRRIDGALRGDDRFYEVIIVDDQSDDGIQCICDDLKSRFPVRLIVRTNERGLSSAVVTGLQAATGKMLVVMDADLSHPPESIPE